MKFKLSILTLLLSIFTYCQEASSSLDNILNNIKEYNQRLDHQDSLFGGHHVKGSFSRINEEYYNQKLEANKQFVNSLESIHDDNLTRQELISKQLMIYILNNSISTIEFNMHLIPLNAEGGFYNEIGFALSRLPFNSSQHYADYLNWLPEYAKWMNDHIELMKLGIDQGIVAPKVVIENNIQLLQPWLSESAKESKFYAPSLEMNDDFTDAQREEIKTRLTKVINLSITPAYERLYEFLKNDYLKAAPEMPGVMFLPNGKAYYENRVAYYTTLDMSPDSVHQVGLREVARIKSQMESIIDELEFEGSFEAFYEFLRTDEQFYAKTPQELLNRAAWLSKKAEAQLPRLFKKLYSLPFTVTPVPEAIAPTYTAGRYSGGSIKQGRAGAYWVNTYKLESRTLYTLPALTLHEAVPGHHLQGALAQELTGIPSFRNNFYTSAFGEGWGLYSEFLGEEMGMYNTLYEQFGRYTYEMWRACRLVIDTGIHYKGWTRDEALEYLKSNTALSIHEVTTEIDRYIGWPGQAVSYKIGELKIKQLRNEAEEALGNQFDIREFHYAILKNGSVTLPVLEEEIDSYIANTLKNN